MRSIMFQKDKVLLLGAAGGASFGRGLRYDRMAALLALPVVMLSAGRLGGFLSHTLFRA